MIHCGFSSLSASIPPNLNKHWWSTSTSHPPVDPYSSCPSGPSSFLTVSYQYIETHPTQNPFVTIPCRIPWKFPIKQLIATIHSFHQRGGHKGRAGQQELVKSVCSKATWMGKKRGTNLELLPAGLVLVDKFRSILMGQMTHWWLAFCFWSFESGSLGWLQNSLCIRPSMF